MNEFFNWLEIQGMVFFFLHLWNDDKIAVGYSEPFYLQNNDTSLLA